MGAHGISISCLHTRWPCLDSEQRRRRAAPYVWKVEAPLKLDRVRTSYVPFEGSFSPQVQKSGSSLRISVKWSMDGRPLPVPIRVLLKPMRGLNDDVIVQGPANELHSEGQLVLIEAAGYGHGGPTTQARNPVGRAPFDWACGILLGRSTQRRGSR